LFAYIALPTLAVCIFAAAAEGYFRYKGSFNDRYWPSEFDPRYGFVVTPGETVRWTNGVDFWVEAKANSLGFVDREPPGVKAPDACRVLFVGDSFVQALHVEIDQKSHVQFERMVRKHLPSLNIETAAVGYGGIGQANQLALFDVFGIPLQPDVVVLVSVANDFSDNSPVLTGVRNGWHPLHLPWSYLQAGWHGSGRSLSSADPEWRTYRFSTDSEPPIPFHRDAMNLSAFYRWLSVHLTYEYPRVQKWINGESQSERHAAYKHQIEQISGFEQVFEGWNYPDDLSQSEMFFAEGKLPPVFEEALEIMGAAFDEFSERAHANDFRLMLLATHTLSTRYEPGEMKMQRRMVDRGKFERISEFASSRGIPLVDQYDYLIGQGGSVEQARFSRDGHWSEQGHEWAAEAMLEYFTEHPEICDSPTS